jgi:hypothetical protein
MVTAMAATPVTRPDAETVASAALDVDHVAALVTFCVVPSDIVAVAVNCDVLPTAGTAHVTVIEETVPDDDGEVAELHPTTKAVSPTITTNEVDHRNISNLSLNSAGLAIFALCGEATAVPLLG